MSLATDTRTTIVTVTAAATLLLACPTSHASNQASRRRAVVLGIDGASGHLVDKRARDDRQAPAILKLMELGVYAPCAGITDPSCARTHQGPRYQAGYQWVTGPGWAAVLSGADAPHHRVKGNSHRSLTAFYQATRSYPTFLKVLHDRGFVTAAAGVGSFLTAYQGAATYHGVIDYECGFDELGPTVSVEATDSCNLNIRRAFRNDDPRRDEQLKDWFLRQIDAGAADILMGVFDQTDSAGHASGYSDNPTYMAALSQTDRYIRELVSLIEHRTHAENEEWLIIVSSDHGGHTNEAGGGSHDQRFGADEVIPFIVSVMSLTPHDLRPLRYPVTQMDIKPTILTWFGIPPQPHEPHDGYAQGLR